jgi:type 1 glutamine amidotransferase
LLAATPAVVVAQDVPPRQRVLLVAQSPDGHPPATHEYVAGLNLLQHLLKKQPRIDVRLVNADPPWNDGPMLLESADAAVLFVSEGAKFVSADADRLAAFQRLAERKGGLACLHWGMGTKTAEPIAAFTALFGGCHGGPDRKYKFLETELRPAAGGHPVTRGISPLRLNEEFYYALKWPSPRSPGNDQNATQPPQPLMEAWIDGEYHPVSWAWERPEGGRSFGFSGLHYHANFNRPEYRRLVVQGVLWTLGRELPDDGIAAESLSLPSDPG